VCDLLESRGVDIETCALYRADLLEHTWLAPSVRRCPALETKSYVVSAGFGHEEWLFNYVWLIDDFRYALLAAR